MLLLVAFIFALFRLDRQSPEILVLLSQCQHSHEPLWHSCFCMSEVYDSFKQEEGFGGQTGQEGGSSKKDKGCSKGHFEEFGQIVGSPPGEP
jgi:hypothetical protein